MDFEAAFNVPHMKLLAKIPNRNDRQSLGDVTNILTNCFLHRFGRGGECSLIRKLVIRKLVKYPM